MIGILAIFLCVIHTSYEHHIVFENIGQLATGVTYLHIKITIPVEAVENDINTYINYLQKMQIKLATDVHRFGSEHTKIGDEAMEAARDCRDTVETFLRDAKLLMKELHLLHKVTPKLHKKSKRQIVEGIMAIGAVVGTIFGIYNTVQIAQLNNKFGQLAENQVKNKI